MRKTTLFFDRPVCLVLEGRRVRQPRCKRMRENVQEFAVRVQELDPRTVVIALEGEVDLANAPAFQEELTNRIDSGARRVVVDLQETTFFDSTALRVLLAGNRELGARNGRLLVVCAEPRIRKIFTVTGLDEVFPFYATIDQALGAADDSAEPSGMIA